MRDDGSITKDDRQSPRGHIGLAFEVIERLAARRTEGVGHLKKELLRQLVEAVRASGDEPLANVMKAFRAERVSAAQIVDLYIPEVARSLGEAWLCDSASFADVTVGVTRLQNLLHEVQAGWGADVAKAQGDSAVLLIVPPGEQHTLGVMVAASMLRRRGISVAVKFSPGLGDLTSLLADRRFDAALITLGSLERLELCAKLVKTLRQMTRGALKVAVGGAVVADCRDQLLEAGADIVTNDIPTVVSEFGL